MSDVLDLRFGPGPSSGFTPAGVSGFDELRPAAVVRELIQNSLDAARIADVESARIRFQLTRIPRRDIPGINSYETAFTSALNTQKEMMGGYLNGQAKYTADRIQQCLEEDIVEVLTILDNGVGLNERRMAALMSDGISAKDDSATGTYGNGHTTVIPSSDLRYVLYGGITKDGRTIGAGHATLASHYVEGEQHHRSGEGFYIQGFQPNSTKPHIYGSGRKLPNLISSALATIRKSSGTGTAVIVPAFNHFREKQNLWSMVLHAAATNFFIAIESGELSVSVEDFRFEKKSKWTLNQSNLTDELFDHRDDRQSTTFLNWKEAYSAHKTYVNSNRQPFETGAGMIEIGIRDTQEGKSRIDLCRNGMWITNKIPSITPSVDRVPFHAILSLNSREGRDLHNYIRISEGPLHEDVQMKRLAGDDRSACRKALRAIKGWLDDNTKVVDSDAYFADDFLTLNFGDASGKALGSSSNLFWGLPQSIRKRPSTSRMMYHEKNESEENHPSRELLGGVSKSNSTNYRRRKRPSLPDFFQAVSCPVGPTRRRIRIKCDRSVDNVQLCLIVDEALDASCERHGLDPYAPVVLNNITINEFPASKRDLVHWENEVIGVRLGDLEKDESIEVETSYQLNNEFRDLSESSLRVHLFRAENYTEFNSEINENVDSVVEQ